MKRIIRDRFLTPQEAAEDQKIRDQIEQEFKPMNTNPRWSIEIDLPGGCRGYVYVQASAIRKSAHDQVVADGVIISLCGNIIKITQTI
jgi:hypothetical protein